ncbi:MAG: hypothetical protein AB7P02_17280 [Alphaproteobacteria bacterium]
MSSGPRLQVRDPKLQEIVNYVDRSLRDVQRSNLDILVQAPRRLILVAPDGGQWTLTVDNSGNVSTTAA